MRCKINKLFIVSGPSGAGKGTLVRELLTRVPNLYISISVTTRVPRNGEVPGISYDFISEKDFKRRLQNGEFLEWAKVHNYFYGTPKEPVLGALSKGLNVILEIDVQGAKQVKEKMPEAVLIFIVPPSIKILTKRLQNRKTETKEEIENRVKVAQYELEHLEKYDYIVTNDILEKAVNELVDIIKKETT
ncbi:MAG: guanylate kinase [Candidatus Subteraquimicrobiales bacterium]|nr:guanylate kinase [Candidatus Subteraquimicrobiales bacterium]